jgi:hypothetical protein
VSDLFREVDEEIRHERYMRLWKRYGPWLIGTAVALVLVVAGYQGWQAYTRDQAMSAAADYAAAVDKAEAGNRAAAIAALGDLSESAPRGYRLVAAFRRAELQAAAGDTQAAIATWQRIATDSKAPKPYGTLAKLFAVMHRMDDGDPGALRKELQPLADGDSPFRTTALELQAVLAARDGERERALELYKQIADGANLPPQQRQRATQMIAQLEG